MDARDLIGTSGIYVLIASNGKILKEKKYGLQLRFLNKKYKSRGLQEKNYLIKNYIFESKKDVENLLKYAQKMIEQNLILDLKKTKGEKNEF